MRMMYLLPGCLARMLVPGMHFLECSPKRAEILESLLTQRRLDSVGASSSTSAEDSRAAQPLRNALQELPMLDISQFQSGPALHQ